MYTVYDRCIRSFFLFVKTTEHLTNDHEKVVFLRKQIGYRNNILLKKVMRTKQKKIDRRCRENCDKFEDVILN